MAKRDADVLGRVAGVAAAPAGVMRAYSHQQAKPQSRHCSTKSATGPGAARDTSVAKKNAATRAVHAMTTAFHTRASAPPPSSRP